MPRKIIGKRRCGEPDGDAEPLIKCPATRSRWRRPAGPAHGAPAPGDPKPAKKKFTPRIEKPPRSREPREQPLHLDRPPPAAVRRGNTTRGKLDGNGVARPTAE